MIKKYFKKENIKSKKAASLTEVMIVLGIISTTLVTSVNILISSLIKFQINEIEDTANTIMLEALEIAKSPSSILVSENVTSTNTEQYYSLLKEDGRNILAKEFDELGSRCSKDSIYFLDQIITDTSRELVICLQIKITPNIGLTNKQFYEVESKIIYNLPGQRVGSNTIKGYRYEEFKR
jgi:competence protein ComGC